MNAGARAACISRTEKRAKAKEALPQQGFFVSEVRVEGGPSDVSPFCNLSDGRFFEALLDHQVDQCLKQRLLTALDATVGRRGGVGVLAHESVNK